MAGYSATPLARKLGVKHGVRVLVNNSPPGFDLGPVDGQATLHNRAGRAAYDVVLAFCPDSRSVSRRFADMPARLTVNGSLWIAWPKRASGLATDVDENVVRTIGLDVGLVDVKVCAIDETWSGLKFVRRLRDR